MPRKPRKQIVVGFYTDGEGETRPITKPIGDRMRKRIIRNPTRFKPIRPKALKLGHKEKELLLVGFEKEFWETAPEDSIFFGLHEDDTSALIKTWEATSQGKAFVKHLERSLKEISEKWGSTFAKKFEKMMWEQAVSELIYQVKW